MFKKLETKADWIWHDGFAPNTWAYFVKSFETGKVPDRAVTFIAAETKYFLYVNGTLAVFDGGLFRESKPGCGYADEVDIAPHLRPGLNRLCVKCWFYGNGGRNNTKLDKPGFLFDSPAIAVVSDAAWTAYKDPGFYTTATENPSYLFGGHNVAYDANKGIGGVEAAGFSDFYAPASVVASYGGAPFGDCYVRPIPLFRFSGILPFAAETASPGHVTGYLPYAKHVSPYFEIEAAGGEVIDIRSDDYITNAYAGHRVEYVCKKGKNTFEASDWYYAESLAYSYTGNPEILKIGYRESGYDAELYDNFSCDDKRLNMLVKKAARTLYVCMRENFMDCPDRERGQWIGDICVQANQIFYVLSRSADALLKKAIVDFITLRKGDILVALVPGDNFQELPCQSLNAIGEHGLIKAYYDFTGEKEILALAIEPCYRYLKLWELSDGGILTPRKGDWHWTDHGYNKDDIINETCWYYSALKFLKYMSDELGLREYDGFVSHRMRAISDNFDKNYWKERTPNKYYASGDFADERANALAALVGLAGEEKYPYILHVIRWVYTASPYMENYILEALYKMGCHEEAKYRILSRYGVMIDSDHSTLWETFSTEGTRNHAWTGGALTMIYKYMGGLYFEKGELKSSGLNGLKELSCEIPTKHGVKKIHLK